MRDTTSSYEVVVSLNLIVSPSSGSDGYIVKLTWGELSMTVTVVLSSSVRPRGSLTFMVTSKTSNSS